MSDHPLLTKVLAEALDLGAYVLADDVTPSDGAEEIIGQWDRLGIADHLERALDVCAICGRSRDESEPHPPVGRPEGDYPAHLHKPLVQP